MADLIFDSVRKVFPGGVVAVEGFDLTIPSPQMVVLVGPSGCGKTTLLRLIAGLETLTSGTIHHGDRRLDTLEPRRRDIAMVFQSYALYPHMNVADNLAFGLRVRKVPKSERERRVKEVAQTLEMSELLDRKPGELSGGQRQRVALGRSIIREPSVFLFDEPLSNLDARLRTEMRATIKRLYQRLRVTSIYVTHDQVEAMTIGERLVVMRDGRIRQVGSPESCYHEPADTFVASFLGSPAMNLIEGSLDRATGVLALGNDASVSLPPDVMQRLENYTEERLVLGVRPEHVRAAHTGGLQLTGDVMLREPLGNETITHVRLADREIVVRGNEEFAGDGEGIALHVEGRNLHLFSAADGTRIVDVG